MIDPLYRLQMSARSVIGQIPLRRVRPPYAPIERIQANEIEFYRRILAPLQPHAHRIETVVDVGCRNWSYARALREAFPYAKSFVGIELDAYRRYWNGFRRLDYAESAAEYLRSTGARARFIPKSFLEVNENDLGMESNDGTILWLFLFPFVSVDPCHAWGLPSENAEFKAFLQQAIELSEPSSSKFIASVHQGDWEFDLAKQSYGPYAAAPRSFTIPAEETRSIWPNPYEHYVIVTDLKNPT